MARHACTAFAGRNVCKTKPVRDVEHCVSNFWRTRLKASAREAAEERAVKIDTVVLIDLKILSLPCKFMKACVWRCRMVVMSSVESQLWNCVASGCSLARLFLIGPQGRLEKRLKTKGPRLVSHITSREESCVFGRGVGSVCGNASEVAGCGGKKVGARVSGPATNIFCVQRRRVIA